MRKFDLSILNDAVLEKKLTELYQAAYKEYAGINLYFLPRLAELMKTGNIRWKASDIQFFKNKIIPIEPEQGVWLYMQIRALQAKSVLEFGTSHGFSTMIMASAVKENGGGRVISTEILPEKVAIASQHLEDTGLAEYVHILTGDALQTLQNRPESFDLVLLDGFPDLVFDVFKIIEHNLHAGSCLIVDDVDLFGINMQQYLDYVRHHPDYISATLHLKKKVEWTIKVK
ncbi:O-methyltransferase [Acinetobacter sp. WZC-1]|uniref:O-methyltransferase n=1 Tax=Acinetobacter sp. WZC-1 TaxID=3459034 RepID=UPI00403E1117